MSTPRLGMPGLVLEWGTPRHPSRSKFFEAIANMIQKTIIVG